MPLREAQHQLTSLDTMGITAAIYPSEDELWHYGPTISPASQGDQGLAGPSQAGVPTDLPQPLTLQEAAGYEEWLNEVLNGPTSNGAYGEEWVNNTEGKVTGWGDWQEQPYMTGPSQIVQSNPAAEQGWGVGPARRWSHYPFSQLDNPVRNAAIHLRNGALPWVTASSWLYERTQLAWEQQWDAYKQRLPVAPVVQVPQSVPFVHTVPTYGGGPIDHPGVGSPFNDYNAATSDGSQGIY